MRTLLFWLLCLVCLVCTSCFLGSSLLFLESDAADKPNLVTNPGFESKSKQINQIPVGWIINPSGLLSQEVLSSDPTEFVTGTQSLKIVHTQRKLTLLSEPFRIDPWNGYYIRASAKTTNPDGAEIFLRFQTYAEDGTITNNYSAKNTCGSEWKRGSISAGFINKKATFARVLIVIPQTNDHPIWIDDVGCFSVHRFILD